MKIFLFKLYLCVNKDLRWHILTLCKTLVSMCKQWPPFGMKICLPWIITLSAEKQTVFWKRSSKKLWQLSGTGTVHGQMSKHIFRIKWKLLMVLIILQIFFETWAVLKTGENHSSNDFAQFWKLPIFSYSSGIFCHNRWLDKSYWAKIFDEI